MSNQQPLETYEQLFGEEGANEPVTQTEPQITETANPQEIQQQGIKENPAGNKADTSSEPKSDKAGEASSSEIIDLENANNIPNGVARRLWESRELVKQQLSEREATIQTLHTEYQKLVAANNELRTIQSNVQGVPAAEAAEAIQLYTALKTDPTKVISELLTFAAQRGIAVEGLQQQAQIAAVQAAVKEELARLSSTPQEQQQQQQLVATVEQFFHKRPDALIHDDLIAKMIQADASLSLDDAYYQLRNAFVTRGLDWNKSLEEQLKQQAAPNQPAPVQQQKPLSMGSSNVSVAPIEDMNLFGDTPTDDVSLVKQVMQSLQYKG